MKSAREKYRDDLSDVSCFPRMSFSSHASSTEPVTLDEVERISAPTLDASRRLAGRLLWGPIPANIAKDAGASFPTASVLLQPHVTPELRAALMREIPADVLPQPGDTAAILARRLAGSTFLEDSHVLKGGRGPQRVRLNATTYKQPRRRSWSVLVKKPARDSDHPATTYTALNYTAFGRLPADWRARPMPRPVMDLGHILWTASFPFPFRCAGGLYCTQCQTEL